MKKAHRSGALLAAAALLAPLAVGLASAGAAPLHDATKGAKAVVLGNVRIDPKDHGVATVTAQYSCPAGESHLWVSVKQAKSLRPENALKQEGSSAISAAWLQRHPGPTEYTCDGRLHTGTFKVDNGQTEYGFGQLRPGQVYVQFCLTGPGGSDTTPPDWFAIDQRFASAG